MKYHSEINYWSSSSTITLLSSISVFEQKTLFVVCRKLCVETCSKYLFWIWFHILAISVLRVIFCISDMSICLKCTFRHFKRRFSIFLKNKSSIFCYNSRENGNNLWSNFNLCSESPIWNSFYYEKENQFLDAFSVFIYYNINHIWRIAKDFSEY